MLLNVGQARRRPALVLLLVTIRQLSIHVKATSVEAVLRLKLSKVVLRLLSKRPGRRWCALEVRLSASVVASKLRLLVRLLIGRLLLSVGPAALRQRIKGVLVILRTIRLLLQRRLLLWLLLDLLVKRVLQR